MGDKVQQKLLELGYDQKKSVKATDRDLVAICKGHLSGLVLLSGRVTVRGKYEAMLQGEDVTVLNHKEGALPSLYVSYLERRFPEEGVLVRDVQPNDVVYTTGMRGTQHRYTFSLVIDDARKNNIITLEFWQKGEMLYVPKRS